MKYFMFSFFILMVSCSFKSPEKDKKNNEARNYEEIKPEDLSKMDTDGDRINDLEEKQKGLNPFVADIPELRARFLQNYSIKVNWHVKTPDGVDHTDAAWDFTIDTRVGRNDPDFKYRVGEILVRNKAFEEASRIGRFSTHSWGEIKESDLTRVIYPEVDTRFSGVNALKTGQYFDNLGVAIDKVTVELENTVKLLPNSLYSSVKNLELNFYYFDYKTESYELLTTKTVDRHFNRDVNETFSVILENVPLDLISQNYLKRGEFIISEVKDFEIPEIGIKYSELMGSVKAKTIQMVMNTPLETTSAFVAPYSKKNRFSDLMENIYPKQHKIEEDKLVKVGQFENNLPDYTHLKEVKIEDKKGKWFVFTDRMSQTYLDHEYLPGESIVLSYVTGKELSAQTSEKVNSLRFSVSGNDDFEIYPLGNVSPNSIVDFQLSTGKRTGEGVDKKEDHPVSGGDCGSNCHVWQYQCHFKFNTFKKRNEGYEFKKDLTEELTQLSLIINEEEFNLKKLVEEKKVEVFWQDQNAHFRISDISKIKEIIEADENVISLKLTTLTETTHDGVFLVSYSGRESYGCFELAAAAAYHQNIPVYEGSKDFNQWSRFYNWNVLKIGKDRAYKQPFTMNVSSIVNNYFN
ncbi:MAG: hypothetical protein K2P81_00445 [Bacteriovoracaceae bacterium]|nr:hypothetical protein [Bacteriovoracaceae bacterium]